MTSWSGIGRALAAIGLVASTAACATTAPTGAPVDLGSSATPAPPDPAVVAADRAAGIPLFVDPPGTAVAVNLTPDAPDSTASATVSEVSYQGADGFVPALLVQPPSAGLQPAVILLAGMPGTRRDLLPRAIDLANAGVISLVVDAPFARPTRIGPGTQPINFTTQDRDEQVQLILDLRRAVDLLVARPDVDQNAIGFLGVGYGADMGGLLAGVEPRLAASVLESGDGGLVSYYTAIGDVSGLPNLTPAAWTLWIAAMDPIEPLYFVGNAAGPILFQSGIHANAEAGARFAAAGNAQSSIKFYETGFDLGDTAACDAAGFLGDHLGFDGSAVSACGTAPAKPDPVSWIAIVGLFVIMIVVRLVVRMRQRRPPPPPDADDDLGDGSTPPIIRVGSGPS